MLPWRRKTKQLMLAAAIGAGVTGAIFTAWMIIQTNQHAKQTAAIRQAMEAEINRLKEAASEKRQIRGWAPSRPLPAGYMIRAEDVVPIELPAQAVPADLLNSRDMVVGKAVKLPLQANTLLTESLIYEEEPTSADLRYREMGFIQLPGTLSKQDTVDVRIQFPTGQDYILLSKKRVSSLSNGVVTMTLNEAEILSLSSAIVDAYLHKASIYALLYVEPGLQAKAVPTYPANDAVLGLIRKDPNIVRQAEQALNRSARAGLEADLAGMSAQTAAEFAGLQASGNAPGATAVGKEEQFVMRPSD
ncbi:MULTISPECIES: SAF domain-containing protein [Paenibacillus]|uniref:SAF domain-containing protein n=1 Tax=Paenibacillus TaxID=44249 RepID=UPI002FE1FD4C